MCAYVCVFNTRVIVDVLLYECLCAYEYIVI